jgi:hypothetical protein
MFISETPGGRLKVLKGYAVDRKGSFVRKKFELNPKSHLMRIRIALETLINHGHCKEG